MRILFLDPGPGDYDPATPLEKTLSAGQSAVSHLTVELAKRRHKIILLNSTKRPREVLGVECHSVQQFATQALAGPLDALVFVDGLPEQCLQLRPHLDPVTPLVYWAQSSAEVPALMGFARAEVREGWDAIVCVSEAQRAALVRRFGLNPGHVFLLHDTLTPAIADEWEAAVGSWKRARQRVKAPASARAPAVANSGNRPQPVQNAATVSAPGEPWLEVTSSRYFADWLGEQRVSLGFTTYQSGKLFLLGRNTKGTLSIHERTLNRVMGMWASEQTLWMSTLFQLWRFENALRPGELYQDYDRLYIPKVGYTTGDIDIHDIAVEANGRVVFVNTKFGCLATINERYSFTPLWKPPFVSKLAPEDRCHLNGLALENGEARYVTAVSTSDVNDAWRDRRRDGGVVVSVPDGGIVASGLSMPHSPRLHKGDLWVLNSGQGYLGKIDRQSGKFEPVAFCPGYLRGLAFIGDFAVVGLSQPRHDKTFSGLPLDEELTKRNADSRCGLQVIDLRSGDIAHWLRLEGVVRELYDVVALPGVARPMALGFQTTEIQQILSIGDEAPLDRGP